MDPDTVPREMFNLAMQGVYTLCGVIVTIFGGAWTIIRADRARMIEAAREDRETIKRLSERLRAAEKTS